MPSVSHSTSASEPAAIRSDPGGRPEPLEVHQGSADGNVMCFEQAVVANMTGMTVAKRGCHGYSVEPGTPISEAAKLWDPEELLALAFEQPSSFPPGEGWEYSNTNTVLLGLLIEQLAGPVSEEFKKRMLGRGCKHKGRLGELTYFQGWKQEGSGE